ncbi:MAG TPA: hypothetical protein VFQ53_05675 [Kofleriaceae bacterium]|nr:hypothetical protein [Kofleriaceae bacterium]
MLRPAWLLVLVASCGEPRLVMKPLPELATPAVPLALVVPMLHLVTGESMIWDVQWRGMTIGRAELAIDDHEIRSKFATGKLASAFAHARHELVTVLDAASAHVVHATDVLELDGETTHLDLAFHGTAVDGNATPLRVPPGNLPHTLHSALGVIRAWASRGAPAGFLYIVHAGELVRLDVAQPVETLLQNTPAWKIDGQIRVGGDTIALTLWLSADARRLPLRIELSANDEHITAELIAS